MEIDEGMRFFLSWFDLPGEAQKVDRILLAFSEKFSQDNPGYYDADTLYSFCYLLMMLHTDAHNPQVIKKMQYWEFER